ncbi:hypothetical protein [Croceicoccus sp. BE223]|uniref:hypothetical protein n=1 Tax=Croceicoccus sp. BE223 TaxID=2817716 RepID=UPI00285CB7A5|nr:hypothetical protein [Croceicoccus sp. BE223]MDR7101129.1 hypothetical protein [Croceicoccus sp. BE223]
MTRRALALASVLLLAGCGGQDRDRPYSEDDDVAYAAGDRPLDGGAAARAAAGADRTPDLPDGLSVYPGARVEGVSNVALPDRRRGTLVAMTSRDPAQKVADWYAETARKAGYEVATPLRAGSLLAVTGEAADGREFSLGASPRDIAPGQTGSSIQLVASAGPALPAEATPQP